ncbi:5'-nucleotidase, partial [Pseudomonas sp. TNT2022 ID1025]
EQGEKSYSRIRLTTPALTGHGTLQQMWGPALPAMRRVGGARSQERYKPYGLHLIGFTPLPNPARSVVATGHVPHGISNEPTLG